MNMINDYTNTDELKKKFPAINETPITDEIGRKIQNRLLSGFENWNRGFDAWKAWGDILYTPESIYNVHGARLTLAEYQAAMNSILGQVPILMGNFHNMIIRDNWCAIRYDMSTVIGDNSIPDVVMEFVKFKDYGEELGTRVIEGWGSTKDNSFPGMAAYQTEAERSLQQKEFDALLAYQIPETDDLNIKYPIIHPTSDDSNLANEIRNILLMETDKWNQGVSAWTQWADSVFCKGAVYAEGMRQKNLSSFCNTIIEKSVSEKVTRKYFDSMLISGDWAATHIRIVTEYLQTGEKIPGDRMHFYHFIKHNDGIKITGCWMS